MTRAINIVVDDAEFAGIVRLSMSKGLTPSTYCAAAVRGALEGSGGQIVRYVAPSPAIVSRKARGALTDTEIAIISALRDGRLLSLEALASEIALRRRNGAKPSGETVRVHVAYARAKLARSGIQIETVYGRGYVIRQASLERLSTFLPEA